MVWLVVDWGRLLGGRLDVVRLLRWRLLSRRWLLIRCRRRGPVRRLSLRWDVLVLPRYIYATITVTHTEPPLESTTLLVL